MSTNILILSVGTRNKIVDYFIESLDDDSKVVVTDMSSLAPALYNADKYYIVPSMNSDNYLSTILEICQKTVLKCKKLWEPAILRVFCKYPILTTKNRIDDLSVYFLSSSVKRPLPSFSDPSSTKS